MANLQGYRSGAVGNMLNHYTRHYMDPDQERWRYGNIRIDKSRTHLNYAIFERDDPVGFIRARVAQADTKPTKATNVLSDWVITLPKNERLVGREREFFEAAFEFFKTYIGEENVVGFYIHRDERSDHGHLAFVSYCEQVVHTNDLSRPLLWTARDEARNPQHKAGTPKRDSKGSVRYERVVATDENGIPLTKTTISQSKMFDRKTMREIHPKLSALMQERFGFDVGVELQDEGDKVLSRLEHGEYIAAKKTLQKTKQEVERMTDKREEIRKQAAEEQDRLEELQQARNAAQMRVRVMEAVFAECRVADDAAVSRKSELFDRIAALCNRIVERLGVAVRNAKDKASRKLTISVGRTADAGSGLNGRPYSTRGAVGMPLNMPQPQMEREFSL